ncbi:aldo-keto reductase family 1 member B1 [Neolamprologus brichardi]|uniref:aldo-keto reductase family 1 member B1 n=1 Tax=Neolamprologus brichardi TaxID=32507 RepID=UPI001643B6F9|nr:aldo-keto reductase family 1 member B1 [Neolamprologus brichardi]
MGDELFPRKDGKIVTSDVDYVDVWRTLTLLSCLLQSSHLSPTSIQGAVETGIAAGYRHIDTAYSYQNEVDIGKALRSKMQQGVIRREDMFIVSKVGKYLESRLDCCTFTCRPQVELHPYLIQTDMIEFCKSKNIALTAYSPFGSPGRPSELLREDTDPRLSNCIVLVQEYSVSIFRASLSVSLQIFDFSLTEEDMSALKGLNRGWKACAIEEIKSHPYYPFT